VYNLPVNPGKKCCWIATLILLLAAVATPEPLSQLHPTDYVNDFAHVLDQNTIAQMDDIARQIDQKAHAQIAVVTVNTLDGSDIESYAVELFKRWGIGSKATNRGVLILYAIRDRRARIEVGYGLEPILPDGKVGSFQREAIPLMRAGNYSAALLLVTRRVGDVIAQDAGVQLTGAQPPSPPRPQSEDHDDGLPFGAIIVIIVIVIVLLVTPLRRLLFWILFSQMLSGGGGSYRGGGWGGGGFGGSGGFGGGGGFGGFGGGSSGGGGASSSW
jgi:uncharacterized protein